MPSLSHVMPNPMVVPILWGHDYVAYPQTAKLIEQMVSDVATGPFMNGMTQYGVRRGRMHSSVVVDDQNPPSTIVYTDKNNNLVDEITQKLIGWIKEGLVPAPEGNSDIDTLYLIIPPTETTPEMYNGASDPIGNGVQGWHNEGRTNPGPPPTYYWAIVKTNDCGPASAGLTFVNNFSHKVAHELAEQFTDRNGTFEEVGDPCNNTWVTYRGWQVQQYWSDWDNSCIYGDRPPFMPTSFQTVDGYESIFVLGTDGNLWIEQAPFGTLPPKRSQVDGSAYSFQALSDQTVFVLGTDGNLWIEQAPFGRVPPSRQQVDGSVQAFQALDTNDVMVLSNDGNLWLETSPWGKVPPPRVQVDATVKQFHAVNSNYIFVLGKDGNLWLETGPFGKVPPSRQQVDANVRSFAALGVYAFLWVLGTDGTLWLEFSPFGKVPPQRLLIDSNVLIFQPLDINDVVVLRTDGTLWLEQGSSGTPARTQIDGNVMEFTATDSSNILVLGGDGNLWWEQGPFGTVPPKRYLVDAAVA